jgi:hypothetical protein
MVDILNYGWATFKASYAVSKCLTRCNILKDVPWLKKYTGVRPIVLFEALWKILDQVLCLCESSDPLPSTLASNEVAVVSSILMLRRIGTQESRMPMRRNFHHTPLGSI